MVKEQIDTLIQNNQKQELLNKIILLYMGEDTNQEELALKLYYYVMDFFKLSKYDEFIYFSEAIQKLCVRVGSAKAMVRYYELASTTSYLMGDYDTCISILQEFAAYTLENDIIYEHVVALGNIISIYYELGEFSIGDGLVDDTLSLIDENPETESLRIHNLINKAKFQLELGNSEAAKVFLDLCHKKISEEMIIGDQIEIAALFGKYYFLVDDFEESLRWLNDAVKLVEENEISTNERYVYKQISKVYYANEMYMECSDFQRKYIAIVDEAFEKVMQLTHKKVELETYIRLKEYENQILIEKNTLIKEENNIDFMTGIYNRRYIDKELMNLQQAYISKGDNYSVMIIDIDRFKNVNDSYGHLVGDTVIKEVSHMISATLDHNQVIGRTGGDEFIICFRNESVETSIIKAERIRMMIEKHNIRHNDLNLFVTISGGIVDALTVEELSTNNILEAADKLLYVSKNSGRNQISKKNKEIL